jgi:hypothetical protein
MRDYGVVHSTYWTSATSHDFSDDAKLLGCYLLTGPHSSALGCFRMPDGYVTDDLIWNIERVKKGFNELSQKGWADRCETTKWVLIRNYLKFNPPQNPNQVVSLRRLASQVPENCTLINDLKTALLEHCGRFEQGELFDSKVNPSGTVAKQSPNQDQDQNHIQNQIKSGSSEPSGSKPSSPANGSVKVLINLPMLGKKEFPIDEHQAREWESLYPAVDVMQELRKMRGWLIAHPERRKVKPLRFVNGWLAKEQDRAPSRPSTPKSFTQANPDAEIPWPEKSQGEKSGLVNLWTRDVRGGWEKMSEDERGKRVRLLAENYPFVLPEQWPKWMQPHLAASKKARA